MPSAAQTTAPRPDSLNPVIVGAAVMATGVILGVLVTHVARSPALGESIVKAITSNGIKLLR